MHPFFKKFPQVQLEIIRGRARVRVRDVEPPVFLIGRAEDCDLVLGDPSLPELHSYLFVRENGVFVRHVGHGSALLIDGLPTEQKQIEDQTVLGVGGYEFRVHITQRTRSGGDDHDQTNDSHSKEGRLTRAPKFSKRRRVVHDSIIALGETSEVSEATSRREEYPTLIDEAEYASLGVKRSDHELLDVVEQDARDQEANEEVVSKPATLKIYLGPEVSEWFQDRRTA